MFFTLYCKGAGFLFRLVPRKELRACFRFLMKVCGDGCRKQLFNRTVLKRQYANCIENYTSYQLPFEAPQTTVCCVFLICPLLPCHKELTHIILTPHIKIHTCYSHNAGWYDFTIRCQTLSDWQRVSENNLQQGKFALLELLTLSQHQLLYLLI